MSRIFWDTNLYIYLIEDRAPFGGQVAALRRRMNTRGDQLFTSTLTLGEVLVRPLMDGDHRLAAAYESALKNSSILLPFEEKTAVMYARLRGDQGLRAPDAIQLACAATAGMDLFITNDARLHNRRVNGIQFIAPLDRVPI